MAGIGVRLNRIFEKNTITTNLIGFSYSTVVTIAPMMVVILNLILMEELLEFSSVGYATRELFSCTILYIFIFALLTASPFNAVLSRYMSDVIYEERYQDILPCYQIGMLLNIGLSCLVGIPFCLWEHFVGKVSTAYVFCSFCGYISLVLVFYSMIYLSICKDYQRISQYFFFGMLVAFVHIAYGDSGYTREMDRDCYEKMDVIYTVSGETRRHFLEFYPEYEEKVQVFHNIIDRERIEREAKKPGGFSDSYDGVRILTVGRLAHQKAYDIAILAMKQIRDAGYKARWYVVGEGPERKALEKQIAELRLQKDFILLGIKENPFPYYAQCDLYVHATRFEGKSIAIQEAQALGCAVIASDCAGNREQIEDGVDGLLCLLTQEGIARKIEELIDDTEKKERIVAAAKQKGNGQTEEIWRLLDLMK